VTLEIRGVEVSRIVEVMGTRRSEGGGNNEGVQRRLRWKKRVVRYILHRIVERDEVWRAVVASH